MAYIRPYRGTRWRAEVFKHGTRKSQVFDSREQAEVWAEALERISADRHVSQLSMADRLELARKVDFTGAALVTSIPRRVLEANAAAPFAHAEVLGAAVPYASSSGIYFLIRGNEVVYVGQSLDVLYRIARHRREGKAFDGYAVILAEQKDLDRLEALYISAFVPAENMMLGNATRKTPSSERARKPAGSATSTDLPPASDGSSG